MRSSDRGKKQGQTSFEGLEVKALAIIRGIECSCCREIREF